MIFTKASCPTCRWAAPYFQRMHELYGDTGLSVVAIAQGDEADERTFVNELGLTYPVALEPSPWSFAAAHGLTTVPTSLLVDTSGDTTLMSPGFSRDDLLDVASRAAAAGGGELRSPFPEGVDVPAFRPG
ncbi:MAG: hypothetical protein DHS20C21_17080 [Gemmatimonadota bacterium]|nr:MAG: hypothetical protein DHS20C21_17080 [Gemmatimonadota bacterium]